MKTAKFSSYLTLLSVLLILTFYIWISISPFGYRWTPILLAIMFILMVLTLRTGARRSEEYWSAVPTPPQTPRVLILIATCIGFQFVAGALLQLSGHLNWFTVTLLATGTGAGFPLLFLVTKIVHWPQRRASPSKTELAKISVVAIFLASFVCYLGTKNFLGAVPIRLPGGLLTDGSVVLLSATMEEILFRVLLLTALIASTGSRFQALVLSSTLFALAHVPLALTGPLVALDWAGVADYAAAFAPEMIWKIGFGFLFGALWLRTGSLALIAVLHSLTNFGPVLAAGFVGLVGWA